MRHGAIRHGAIRHGAMKHRSMRHRVARALSLIAVLWTGGCDDGSTRDPSGRSDPPAATAAEQDTIDRAQALLAQNPREAYDTLAPLLDSERPPPKAQLIAGLAANALKRYVEATERLQDAVDRDPSLWPAMSALGAVYLGLGQLDRARITFESVLERAPGQARAYLGLGQVALEEGDAGAALIDLDRAIAKNRGLVAARFHRARALSMLDRADEAAREIDQVLSANPTHAKALYLKAQLLTRAGRAEEAEQVLALRAEVYALREKVESMISHTQGGGGDADTFAKIVQIMLRLEDREEAVLALRAGLARFPGDDALRALAEDLRP